MDRRATTDAVVRALRRVNFEGSLFGQSVAVRVGLSESDIEALECLLDTGASTAGRLADLMGLTTGAVTRVIDRLEQAGYVRRTADPGDRRRVIVEVVPERAQRIEDLLGRLGVAGAAQLDRYSEAELAVIDDFLTFMAGATRTEVDKLRETPMADDADSEHAAPLAGLTAARLTFRSGASDIRLRGSARAGDLYRAQFEGATPQVRLRDGRVLVQYRGIGFDWRKRVASMALNPAIPWSIEVVGGIRRLEADLTSIDLRRFDLLGGTERVQLELGPPHADVAVRITGGARSLRLEPPAGAPLRLKVTGGVSRLEVDRQVLGHRGGETIHETAGWAGTTSRYDIQVTGGAKSIEVVSRG